MNDPLSPLTVPPPRYLLESDSSDEEGQGYYPGTTRPSTSVSSRSKVHNQTSPIVVHWSSDPASFENVLVGVEQVGWYLQKKLMVGGKGEKTVEVTQGGKRIGRGWEVGKELVLMMDEGEGGDVWDIAKVLLSDIETTSWTIASTYLPSTYIPNSNSTSPSSPPIRYLTSAKQGLDRMLYEVGAAKLDSPNYVMGLSAGMASLAINPSLPFTYLPLTLLLLPLPLSHIPLESLIATLHLVTPGFAAEIAKHRTDAKTRWYENDDEPYSGPGMGRRVPKAAAGGKDDVGGMYM